MKNRPPLTLMEQMVMLLVFALAAALCLQAFVKSDEMSGRSVSRDRAAVLCQSAAEAIRHSGDVAEGLGTVSPGYAPYGRPGREDDVQVIFFDEDWAPLSMADCGMEAPSPRYELEGEQLDSGMASLGKAAVRVIDTADGQTLFQIEVAWQEVSGGVQ